MPHTSMLRYVHSTPLTAVLLHCQTSTTHFRSWQTGLALEQYWSVTTSTLLATIQCMRYATQRTLSRVHRGEFASFYPINRLVRIISAPIVEIEEACSDMQLLDATHAAAAQLANATPCSACKAGLNSFASAQLWKITFADMLPPEVTALTFLNADNISNTGAIVEDSEFSGSISNLGRFKSSGGVLRRNTWHRGPTATPTNNNLEVRQRHARRSAQATLRADLTKLLARAAV